MSAKRYGAFISYSHSADNRLAPAIQNGLQGFAKPWYRRHAVRIFRDQTGLSVAPALRRVIEQALDNSDYFLLLASPGSAKSEWVMREITYWLAHHSPERMLIVLTDGDIFWDSAARDFDWNRTTALPAALRGVFADEPLYVDLRWAKNEAQLSRNHPRFLEAIADLAATIRGMPKEDLVGEDMRQHRRTLRIAWAAVAVLLVLLLTAGTTAAFAVRQRDEARRQRESAQEQTRLATSRQLAAQALNQEDEQYDLALLLSLQAARTADTFEATDSLFTTLEANPSLVTYLRNDGRGVNAVVFARDGTELLTAGCAQIEKKDASLRCVTAEFRRWDVASHRSLGPPVHEAMDAVLWPRLAISPDGTIIVTTSGPDIILRDPATFAPIDRLPGPQDEMDEITDIVFDPDGSMLASAAGNNITLWDIRNRHSLGRLPQAHEHGVISLTFSNDGRLLASGGGARTAQWGDNQGPGGGGEGIRLWDVAARRPIGEPLTGPRYSVYTIAFSPDDSILASGSGDGLTLWRVASRTPIAGPLPAHPRTQRLAFVAGGSRLVSVGYEGDVVLWDAANGEVVERLAGGHTDIIYGVAVSPDGRTVATGGRDGTTILWDTGVASRLGRSFAIDPADARRAALSADGSLLVTWTREDVISFWDTASGQAIETPLGLDIDWYNLNSVAVDPAHNILAVAVCRSTEASGSCDRQDLRYWDLGTRTETGQPIVDLTSTVTALAFSPDGRRLVTVTESASAYNDVVITVWDVATGQQLLQGIQPGLYAVSKLVFSPADGETLALAGCASAGNHAGCANGVAILWNIATGRQLGDPIAVPTDGVSGVAFSPDGTVLATAGAANAIDNNAEVQARNNIVLWNVATRQPIATLLAGYPRPIEDLAFVENGHMLVAQSSDGLAVWDVDARRRFGDRLIGDAAAIDGIVVGDDGSVVTIDCTALNEYGTCAQGRLNRVTIWDIGRDSWQSRACSIAARELTPDERQTFAVTPLTGGPICPATGLTATPPAVR